MRWNLPWAKRPGTTAPGERKAVAPGFVALHLQGEASWTRRDYAALAREGFMRNPVAHRSVRLIAEAASAIGWLLYEDAAELDRHPLLDMLARPNQRQAGASFMEALYGHLMISGNAYCELVDAGPGAREMHLLRPDRVSVVTDADGWPVALDHGTGRAKRRIALKSEDGPGALHLRMFHPLDDHYGLSPLEAAAQSLDIHNAASEWNKALLDNAARPSGALVYRAGANLTEEQFARLKAELEAAFSGAANAGRPMVLDGGLDWKSLSLTPAEMDFIELKHVAAREIALAFGVPPMLLGIPGDNTYANMAEANRMFWRQTVVPLVRRVADDLSFWLAPAFGAELRIIPEFDAVEALAEDRAALWARVTAADFLTDAEKRQMLGLSDQAAR